MNKFLVCAVLCLFGMSFQMANAAVETIRIYPTDDGVNVLYDTEELTNWDQAREYSGLLARPTINDSEALVVRSDNQSGYFRIYRTSMSFDTGIIPNNAVIQAASINLLKFPTANNHGNTEIVFTSHVRAIENSLDTSDWYLQNYGTEFARGLLLDSQYTPFVLNTAGIEYLNMSGQTIFGGMTEFDFDNLDQGVAPLDAAFYASDASGTTSDPYLEITYTVPDVEKSIGELISDLKIIVNEQIVLKSNRSVYVAQIKVLEQLIEKQKINTALTHLKVLEKQITLDKQSGVLSSAIAEEMMVILGLIQERISTE